MKTLFCLIFLSLGASGARAEIAKKVVREKVAGIDLIACRTEVENVITFAGSLPAGDAFAPAGNIAIPTLVGEMLDQGTTTEDKFAIAQKLESIGARIDFDVHGVMLEFEGKCLSKDLPLVMSLLAEELRTPAFSEDEFAKLKKQLAGDLQRANESTDFRASQAFAETVFPAGHPNYQPPTPEFLAAVEAARLDDLKKFHAEYYGPAKATLVVVGDFDPAALKLEVAKSFAGWSGGKALPQFPPVQPPTDKRDKIIFMADKPNVTVVLGQAVDLQYRDPDAMALRLGNAAFGSGFSGRLMTRVRDQEGLTYGIRSNVANDSFTGGAWQITANFAPELLVKGMASTKRELDAWYARGITAAELASVKSNMIGTFKVSLANTEGLAGALLNAIERGYDVSWLDEYPKRIAAMALPEVNAAIKKHLQPAIMTTVLAGSVPTTKGNN